MVVGSSLLIKKTQAHSATKRSRNDSYRIVDFFTYIGKMWRAFDLDAHVYQFRERLQIDRRRAFGFNARVCWFGNVAHAKK